MVAGLAKDPNMLQFSTPPPTLRQLFLVVLEMASWINFSGDERHVVLVHQSDLHTSNPTMVLACLIALLNRDIFPEGCAEVLPFI